MNELFQLKKIERAVDMWWEDELLVAFFSRDTEAIYGKAARAAKKAQAAAAAVVEETDPLKRAIKKPSNQKGIKGQGYKGKGRVPAFY